VASASVFHGAARAVEPRTPDVTRRHTYVLGRSVAGRTIVAVETGDMDSPRKAVVVGCIHGNECAGITVAAQLIRSPAVKETDLWVLTDLNPDGAAASTRGNARGVDLNRNFPWRWRRLHGVYESGPSPLSEPETQIAARLLLRLRPSVTIWFHQHLNVVDDSSGSIAVERLFARVAGLRLARLTREPGGAVGWESHCFPRGTAFVVELPAGRLPRAVARRLARAADVAVASTRESRPVVASGCATR
jgi:protein MpaA